MRYLMERLVDNQKKTTPIFRISFWFFFRLQTFINLQGTISKLFIAMNKKKLEIIKNLPGFLWVETPKILNYKMAAISFLNFKMVATFV